MAFVGLVEGNLFSGLEARVLTPAQYLWLDKIRVGFLRRLMRGAATKNITDDEGNIIGHRACKPAAVFLFWRLAPSDLTLSSRRIRMFQTWSKEPLHHKQILAAYFGQLPEEPLPTIDTLTGSLTSYANPWAKQLLADLRLLSEASDAMADLFSIWRGDCDHNFLRPFGCRRFQED